MGVAVVSRAQKRDVEDRVDPESLWDVDFASSRSHKLGDTVWPYPAIFHLPARATSPDVLGAYPHLITYLVVWCRVSSLVRVSGIRLRGLGPGEFVMASLLEVFHES